MMQHLRELNPLARAVKTSFASHKMRFPSKISTKIRAEKLTASSSSTSAAFIFWCFVSSFSHSHSRWFSHIDCRARESLKGINVEDDGRNFIRFHCYCHTIYDSRGCRCMHRLKGNYSSLFYRTKTRGKNIKVTVGAAPGSSPSATIVRATSESQLNFQRHKK